MHAELTVQLPSGRETPIGTLDEVGHAGRQVTEFRYATSYSRSNCGSSWLQERQRVAPGPKRLFATQQDALQSRNCREMRILGMRWHGKRLPSSSPAVPVSTLRPSSCIESDLAQ